MKTYRVMWEINIKANDPQEAVRQAFTCMQAQGTTATVFDVTDEAGETIRIDLLDDSDNTD